MLQRVCKLLFTSKLAVFLLLAVCFFPSLTRAAGSRPGAPRLVNYYLPWQLSEGELAELARWDVLILDMENQVTNPDKLRKLRTLNPSIKLIAYVTSQEIRYDALSGTSEMRRRLASGIKFEWYLLDTSGNRISFWKDTSMLNMSSLSPVVNGKTWSTHLANFVHQEIASSGLWDGIFYDNAWQDVDWLAKNNKITVDANRDGQLDPDANSAWQQGYERLFTETRRLVPQSFWILANTGPGHARYNALVDGIMIESFPEFDWAYTMQVAAQKKKIAGRPALIFNSNTHNTGVFSSWSQMRYGLTSALLLDAYFSFDNGAHDHAARWWYDEYTTSLGDPLGAAYNTKGHTVFNRSAVWRRDFTGGSVLVNPTDSVQTVNLGAVYYALGGSQDTRVNHGGAVRSVTIQPRDGVILLKKTVLPEQSVFMSGSYLQPVGATTPGVFAADPSVPAGAYVYSGDVEGRGTEQKIVLTKNKLEVWSKDGTVLFSDLPLGAQGSFSYTLAVATPVPGQPLSYAVAQKSGGGAIVVYRGIQKVHTIYPLGTTYRGGLSIALADTNGNGNPELIVGVRGKKGGEVLIYNEQNDRFVGRFTPYSAKEADGVSVAVIKDSMTENFLVITAPINKSKGMARFFSLGGKKLKEFAFQTSSGRSSAELVASERYGGAQGSAVSEL